MVSADQQTIKAPFPKANSKNEDEYVNSLAGRTTTSCSKDPIHLYRQLEVQMKDSRMPQGTMQATTDEIIGEEELGTGLDTTADSFEKQ